MYCVYYTNKNTYTQNQQTNHQTNIPAHTQCIAPVQFSSYVLNTEKIGQWLSTLLAMGSVNVHTLCLKRRVGYKVNE